MSKSGENIFSISAAVLLITVAVILLFFVWLFNHPRHSGVQKVYCINNLRQIEIAKNEWAKENDAKVGSNVTLNDITPYIKLDRNGSLPKCPQGGAYTIGKIGELPTCSLGTNVTPAHILQ